VIVSGREKPLPYNVFSRRRAIHRILSFIRAIKAPHW